MMDFHMHSVYSDGTLTPAALVEEGRRIGLRAMALTDHDTTEGYPELLKACGGHDYPVALPGVEISTEGPFGEMHMLGYGFDPAHAALCEELRRIREGREVRNREIFSKLKAAGCAVQWDAIVEVAGAGVMGRPHFAAAMKRAKDVESYEEAFQRYLKRGACAYANRYRPTPQHAIAVLRQSGGMAVLAHPFVIPCKGEKLEALVAELCEAGLGGIEVFYPEHKHQQELTYARLAKAMGLVATGGSDYHGPGKSRIRLGSGYGTLSVPDTTLVAICSRCPASRHLVCGGVLK